MPDGTLATSPGNQEAAMTPRRTALRSFIRRARFAERAARVLSRPAKALSKAAIMVWSQPVEKRSGPGVTRWIETSQAGLRSRWRMMRTLASSTCRTAAIPARRAAIQRSGYFEPTTPRRLTVIFMRSWWIGFMPAFPPA